MVLIIEVKVVPSSGRLSCKLEGERLKCYLKSPPEKGKANAELLNFFAKKIGVPKSGISIISGETNRTKRIKIEDSITFDRLLEKLGIERQMKLF